MNKIIKQFLINCGIYYSKGEFYIPTLEEINEIKQILNINIDNNEEITDNIFDNIYYKSKELWPNDIYFSQLTSNSLYEYGEKVELNPRAGSLDECKLGELQKWINLDQNYVITEKLDGCSIILFYVNGIFDKAVTRGDGYKGKDVTRHIKPLIPNQIDSNFTGMVRGEVICPKGKIPNMLQELKSETGREYRNGRNTIAGYLNSKDTLNSVKKYARVVVYSIMNSTERQEDQLTFLEHNFSYVACHQLTKGKDITDDKMINLVNYYHQQGTYETDGIVITLNEPGVVEYETNSINPKNARKFKVRDINTGISNEIVEMTVIGCEWNPSKDGKLKPIVLFEPKEIDGITISKATGNNYEFLNKLNLHVGQKLLVIRAGSVIPKIIGEA